jgi:hypothetical protein
MNKVKFLISAASLMFAALVFGQTNAANFESEAVVWQKTDAGFVSTFTVEASADGLAQIKERYDGLGQNVSYKIVSTNNNTHTIMMTFSFETSEFYLHKMLIFIGCQSVTIGDKTLSMEELANYLSR